MRPRTLRAPALARAVGTVLIVVLPLLALSWTHQMVVLPVNALPTYVLVFMVAGVAAQLGLVIRRWGIIRVSRLLFDVGLLVAGGVVSWLVVHVALARGGGAVDPSLIALIMAYLLAMWSGQHQ